MESRITGHTRLFGLIGSPVGHSGSPAMYNYSFERTGLDNAYLAFDIPLEKVKNLFCNETGYQTPKVDTRAAVFKEGKILLVHEKNGTWSLPGGWCDVNQSVAENTVKETLEEAVFVRYPHLLGKV